MTNEIKYIYIDDEPNSYRKVEGFGKQGELSVEFKQNESSWEKQFVFFSENTQYDGLMLDLKLDGDKVPDGNGRNVRVAFGGTAIAQEIRTRQKRGLLKKQIPIVLFSANDNVMLEDLGKNLFDLCIEKNEVSDDNMKTFRAQMIDLSNGYQLLAKNIGMSTIFKKSVKLIDSRFVREFEMLNKTPINVRVRFLLNEFINKQGLLIDEDVLAARLGIDKEKSADWDTLKMQLTDLEYKGIFCNGWKRWWASSLEKWWNDTIKEKSRLRTTSAKVRVEKIKEFYHLSNIVAASVIDKANSQDFWTVCKGYGKPLDTIDGLLISGQDNLYPWQEPEYVSIDAALKKKGVSHWHSLADVEKTHIEELKIIFKLKKDKNE